MRRLLPIGLRVGLSLVLLISSTAIGFLGGHEDPFRYLSTEGALLYVVLPSCLGFGSLQWIAIGLYEAIRRRWTVAEVIGHVGLTLWALWMCVVSVQGYLSEFHGCEAPWAFHVFERGGP